MRIFRGYIISVFSAGFAFIILREIVLVTMNMPTRAHSLFDWATDSVFMSFIMLLVVWPLFAIVCCTGEKRRIKNWLYYSASGALIGLAFLMLIGERSQEDRSRQPHERSPISRIAFLLPVVVGSGALGGFAYWAAAGRRAGVSDGT